jgi:hypothetical protein
MPKGKKLNISDKSGKDTNSGSEFLTETLCFSSKFINLKDYFCLG